MRIVSGHVARWPRGILIAFVGALILPGAAPADITMSFDPLNGVIVQDLSLPTDTLTVQVTVDDQAVDLRGFTLVLEFDPVIVTPVSVQAGALLIGAGCPNAFFWLNQAAVGDSIAVDGAALGCSMTGPGNIIEMKFIGVTDSFGVSPLACRSVTMRNSLNEDLPVTCVDGTIEHTFAISTDAVSWGRIKSLYR